MSTQRFWNYFPWSLIVWGAWTFETVRGRGRGGGVPYEGRKKESCTNVRVCNIIMEWEREKAEEKKKECVRGRERKNERIREGCFLWQIANIRKVGGGGDWGGLIGERRKQEDKYEGERERTTNRRGQWESCNGYFEWVGNLSQISIDG